MKSARAVDISGIGKGTPPAWNSSSLFSQQNIKSNIPSKEKSPNDGDAVVTFTPAPLDELQFDGPLPQSLIIKREMDTFQELLNDTSSSIVVPPPPTDFPKECRFRGSFVQVENKKVQTDVASHTGYDATYNGKTYYVKLLKLDPTMPDSDKMVELEAAAWISYHIIEPSIVPAHTFPLYDYDEKTNKYTLSAIASEYLPGFVPNRDDPLTTADLIIHALDNDFGYQRGNVLGLFDQLSKNLKRSCETNYKYVKETFNYYTSKFGAFWNPTEAKPAASYMQAQVDNVLNKSKKESIEQKDVTALVQPLANRLAYLPELIANLNKRVQTKEITKTEYQEEFVRYKQEEILLKDTITAVNNFSTHLLNNTKTDILKLELLDREIRKKNLDIENKDLYPDPNAKVPGYEITISDLHNYRLVKTQAKSLCLSYYRCENDNHNKNNGKKGRVDFDMSLWWGLLEKFKKPNWFEWFKDAVKNMFGMKDKFTYTVEDMENFPNIKTPLRYWPAIASPLDQSSKIGAAPFIENFYRADDVVPFQRLSSHPVFDFHKWKSFLKCALITDEMHQASAEMVIRNKIEFTDLEDNKKKALLDTVVMYEKQQAQAFTDTLVQCPSFKLFLEQYSKQVDTADGPVTSHKIFELIKQEFEEEQLELYKNEVKNGNAHYQPLVDAIDFNKMHAKFDSIYTNVFAPAPSFKAPGRTI